MSTYGINDTTIVVPVDDLQAKLAFASMADTPLNGVFPEPVPVPSVIAAPVAPAVSTDIKENFKAFSKFGDSKSDGKHITLSQSDKWMKQAKVIDKKITTTDTAIHFKKLKSIKLSVAEYGKFLDDLATTKKVELSEIKAKLAGCGAPGVVQSSNSGKAAATVSRLTDTSKYTGSSKQRFDETGKGKGISGRKNLVDDSGYVSGYQNKDTFEKPQ